MLKWLIALIAVTLAIPAFAQAPTVAPSVKFFDGPSIGERWGTPDSRMGLSFNAQTGTTYTVVATDFGKVLTINNGSAIAVTLPVATTTGFPAGGCFVIIDIGAGTATVTPTTSTINGQATKDYATNAGGKICSDGTNYFAY